MPLIAIGQNRKMEDYLESVRRAGGEPVEVLVGSEAPDHLLARVDGLMLTGGGDVDPVLYGEAQHGTFQAAESGRDAFEIALARAAIARRIPFLAICRGMQVVNVAMGGTLFQDIPSQVTGALEHAVPQPRVHIAHEIWVSKGSRLSTLLADHMEDGETCHVNSRHHQSVRSVATGFDVTATSPDGVIEAMEMPDAPFCVAVRVPGAVRRPGPGR
jgi:putative glutamine amidotransferase